MKTKTFKITIDNTNYFGVAVLTKEKKVYLKYFRFILENGIENIETIRNGALEIKAVNEIYKTAQCYYFAKDETIKMWSY